MEVWKNCIDHSLALGQINFLFFSKLLRFFVSNKIIGKSILAHSHQIHNRNCTLVTFDYDFFSSFRFWHDTIHSFAKLHGVLSTLYFFFNCVWLWTRMNSLWRAQPSLNLAKSVFERYALWAHHSGNQDCVYAANVTTLKKTNVNFGTRAVFTASSVTLCEAIGRMYIYKYICHFSVSICSLFGVFHWCGCQTDCGRRRCCYDWRRDIADFIYLVPLT